MSKISRVLQFALSQCWAIEEGHHRRFWGLLMQRHGSVERIPPEAFEDDDDDLVQPPKRQRELRVEKGVAIVPIQGVISYRASMLEDWCPGMGTSVQTIRQDLQAALSREDVKSIVLAVDSPGGSVSGIDELAEEIRTAKTQKPIVAHTENLMASAAYYLASQANQVFATRGAAVGSIGVIASVLDDSRRMQNLGLDPVIVKSVPGKAGVQSDGSIGDNERADIQREVDHYHGLFVQAVAEGRGIPIEKATEMGDGKLYVGSQAAERGYVDGIRSMPAVMKVARSLARRGAAAATAEIEIGDEDEPPLPDGNVAAGATEAEESDMTKTETTGAPQGANPAPAPAATIDTAAVTAAAEKAENARVNAILEAAADAQIGLARELIAKRTPLPEALMALNKDLRERLEAKKPEQTEATAPLGRGNAAQVADEKADPFAGLEGEERWKAQWAADKKLQAEFGGVIDKFLASMRNEKRCSFTSKPLSTAGAESL